ncbi:MAG TPA: isoprenoid biosynthesis protein ElbB, partial [Flavobacteriales bacterium]|nr:isoprenoid biosynthesis protein ElbB [Flavobacteriales bacterium]
AGEIHAGVQQAIVSMVKAGKPVCGLCMGPTVIAKALENANINLRVTVGTTAEKSPYDIAAISGGVQATGAVAEMKTIREICVDEKNKIVTAPCYMMEAGIIEVKNNIEKAIDQLFAFIK